MTTAFELLHPRWEKYLATDPNIRPSTSGTGKEILKALNEEHLSQQMSSMNLDGEGQQQSVNDQLSDALIQINECVLLSVSKSGVKSLSEEANAAMRLAAAVAATALDVFDDVLSWTTKALESPNDTMRACLCTFLGYLVESASAQSDDGFQGRFDVASQALLPRITDKSQAVRLSAIKAGGCFFCDSMTDPDILQALLWSLQHDPSVANRVAAVESVPINLETIDFVIQRIRDEKQKVRVAALDTLRERCVNMDVLDSDHFTCIVQAGNTERCPQTKVAFEKLVCLGWLKRSKYDLISMLKRMAVGENDKICRNIISIVSAAAQSDWLKEQLSKAEFSAFGKMIDNGLTTVSMSSLDERDSLGPKLFLSLVLCENTAGTASGADKASLVVPDISELCEVLEKLTVELIGSIESGDEEKQDELTFCCSQVLKLAVVGDLEEGSRQLLVTALDRLLSSVITPDELIVEAVCALKRASRGLDSFLETVSSVASGIEGASMDEDDFVVNRKIRVLHLIGAFAECTPVNEGRSVAVTNLAERVGSALRDDNSLVVQAAVNCSSKIGLIVPETVVQQKLEPVLRSFLEDGDSSIEVKAQALFCLADWTLADLIEKHDDSFVSPWINKNSSFSPLTYICAEICTKVCLSDKMHKEETLAVLFYLMFEASTDTDIDDDEQSIGSLHRLQQVLSVFFSIYPKADGCAMKLVKSLSDVVYMVAQRAPKGRKKHTWPIAKALDFLLSVTENAFAGEVACAVQVATSVANGLVENQAEISSSVRRAMCKWLGSVSIDSSKSVDGLPELKRALDELEDVTSDKTSLRSLALLIECLENVESAPEEDSEGDDEEQEGIEIESDDDEQESVSSVVEKVASLDLKENRSTRGKAETSVDRRVSFGDISVNN